MKPQRNSPERAQMLAERANEQRRRRPNLRMIGVPASINRHTGKPHEHARAKERRLKHIANLAPLGALLSAARRSA